MSIPSAIEQFTPEVSEKLGLYVYRLIDPRNGETFYVGKGQGNRVFMHARGVLQDDGLSSLDNVSAKISRIREILEAKLEVVHVIHRHDIPREAVFEVEAALIDAYPGLSNSQGGHGSSARGPMNAAEVAAKYALPEFEAEPPFKLILINVNALESRHDRQAIYDQVRFSWRISVSRARRADYVLAVWRGIVIGAFVADKWLPASSANFPVIGNDDTSDRWGFHGRIAEDEIWDRFVGVNGKRITAEAMKHYQNPIRYWSI